MRTEDLLDVLAADVRPVPRAAPQRRLALSAAAGSAIALALVLAWLGLRPDLSTAVGGGFFWIKAAYTAALAAAFFRIAERLSRPGVSAASAWAMGGLVLAVFAGLALGQFVGLDRAGQAVALRGVSWTVCTRNILVLGAPATLITLAVVRGLAPTRPVAAGFAAGCFSGAVAATVYGLHCPEATFVFVGLWYTLGVAACGALGALLGRWMLRW